MSCNVSLEATTTDSPDTGVLGVETTCGYNISELCPPPPILKQPVVFRILEYKSLLINLKFGILQKILGAAYFTLHQSYRVLL